VSSTRLRVLTPLAWLPQVRAVAQGKHTKLDQLKKKMMGIEQAAIQREKLLDSERHKNARLEATMAHLERHLEERNRSLEEKERTIVELRNNNRTLENFRYVLDHRLKQLMEER
jgi:molybdopterin converting factor small subunit